jgi:hypothetical protein
MKSVTAFAESGIAFAEDLLRWSTAQRHQDRIFLEEVVPALPTYNEQVRTAQSLACFAQRRGHRVFLLVDVMLTADTFATARNKKLSPDAKNELEYLRDMLEHGNLGLNAKTLNLKDLGWSSAWRDPHPGCIAFRNSIEAVDSLSRVLPLQELWEYGLVPSDLDEFYIEMMQQAGYLTDVSEALLAEHDGDWRAVLRDESLVGRPLC